jgi:hypothetical protein
MGGENGKIADVCENFLPPMRYLILISSLICTTSCDRPQWPDIKLSPYFSKLVAQEAALAKQPTEYEDYDRREHFRPEGMYSDGKDIFVWSSRHREQVVLAEKGGRWYSLRRRLGPLKTQRCLFIPEGNLGSVCLGAMQPKGFMSFDKRIDFALEPRAGYSDFTYNSGRFFIADSVKEQVILLDEKGQAAGSWSAPAIYRIFTAGKNIIYLSHQNPRLVIFAETGGEWKQAAGIQLEAPVRDLWFDEKTNLAWTVGPKNEVVRRKNGGINNLNSYLYAYKIGDLLRGKASPEIAADLGKHGLVDAISLTPSPQGLLIAARGSSKYARVSPEGGLEVFATGLAGVAAVWPQGQDLLVAGMFSDAVKVFSGGGNPALKISLNPRGPPPLTAADKGEMIFYSRAISRDLPQNQYSCESCHWDRLTDHRIHYGGGGTQGLIRPPRGIGMVSHPMPDMEYDSISKLVEEFFKAMDYEFWSKPKLPEEHWQNDKILFPDSDAPVKLAAEEARSALLHYLMRLPVERPVLRIPGETLTGPALQGFEIFARDCMRCHEAVTNMRDRRLMNRSAVPGYLKNNPLVFGAPLFMKMALPHPYTPHGTRVNPLTNLGRGGPFLTRGVAKSLHEVVKRTNPNSNQVHFADDSAVFYTADEINALTAFLLSI